jgi:RsiW-degrading membrane proteinase PrsW (M82 family)
VSQVFDNRIIAPPTEDEVYPYRRVWRSIRFQVSIMILLTVSIVSLGEIFGLQLDKTLNLIVSGNLIFSPVLLWLIFSIVPEQFVPEPRTNLITVAIISALTGLAIGIPLVNEFFQIDRWLPLESAFQRILGFTFTVGIVDSALKFLVIRYIAFPQNLRMRSDTIAYCVASAIGYSFVVSLHYISEIQPNYSIAMLYIFSNYTIQLASSLFIAYGISETYFNNPIPIVLPISIFFSALVVGLISPFVSGLMNSPLTTSGNTDRPLFSLGFLIVVLILSLGLIFFFYTIALQRDQKTIISND